MDKKIFVIMTGGTICSAPDDNNKRDSDASAVRSYLIDGFRASSSPYRDSAEFEVYNLAPNDILSENMTLAVWDRIIAIFRGIRFEDYSGIIVLHGTDTLAYTSALLSIMLAGISVPVMMVSAQLPLVKKCGVEFVPEESTNGYANFRAAAELILNGIKPNVYAVYRNIADDSRTSGEMLVHFGAELEQCPNFSNNFASRGAVCIEDTENARLDGRAFKSESRLFEKIRRLDRGVMYISPYVGLDYSRICVDGLSVVVHGTYHSESLCVERKSAAYGYSEYSVLCLLDRLKKRGIPLFLAPCGDNYSYASTGDALGNGAGYISGMPAHVAYVKTVVGCSLGYSGEKLNNFLNTDINYETVTK